MVGESPDATLPTASEAMEKWVSIKSEMSPGDREKHLLHRSNGHMNGDGYTIDVTAIIRVILHIARSLISFIRG